MAYIYVCHVCLYAFMPFACYMCANGCKLVQMYAPLHINKPAKQARMKNTCEPNLKVQTIGYLPNTSCNMKYTHKTLPKLADPRDAKVRSIQQNPITLRKLLLISTTIRKPCLMFLGPLQRCTKSMNQLTLLLSKILYN